MCLNNLLLFLRIDCLDVLLCIQKVVLATEKTTKNQYASESVMCRSGALSGSCSVVLWFGVSFRLCMKFTEFMGSLS